MPARAKLRPLGNRLALPCAAAAVLAACAAKHQVLIAPQLRQSAPAQVAVLLMENDALDLNAPDMLRALAYARLRAKGYSGPPLAAVDEKLRGIGITDGGQLRSLDSKDIGQALGVDGLLFGEIEQFANTDLGYVMRKAVRVRLTLVDASTGDKLWEDEESAQKVAVRTDTKQAEQGALLSLGERAVANMLKKPLYEQSVAVMDQLFATLPPAGPPAGPPSSSTAPVSASGLPGASPSPGSP